MIESFESFVTTVTRAYKYIQQAKKHESVTLNIKGIHVMCLYFLGQHPEGLTLTELSTLCCEDKAATSRNVNSLVEKGYVTCENHENKRRWRSKIVLTEAGKEGKQIMDHIISDIVKNTKEDLSEEEIRCFYKVFFAINEKLAAYCHSLEHAED